MPLWVGRCFGSHICLLEPRFETDAVEIVGSDLVVTAHFAATA